MNNHFARILLIIGGGIAAYKTPELVRRLQDVGAEVKVVLTKAGKEFVTPLALAGVSHHQVYEDLFSLIDEAQMGHIRLARETDLVLIAPATADLMAKIAHGMANDLASTLLLATTAPILIAPAMNAKMWENPATQRNLEQLIKDGIHIIGPDPGALACGEEGVGRMSDVPDIVAAVQNMLSYQTKKPLKNKHVIITSGPTRESLDPIRYMTNRSSGRQGHAIAAACAQAGARVSLVTGPTALPDPPNVDIYKVQSAQDMWEAVEKLLPADVFIGAAAVADWRVVEVAPQKMKKTQEQETLTLTMVKNIDILAAIGCLPPQKRPNLVVGFAAETENLIGNAQEKLLIKGCDMIIANDVSAEKNVMEGTHNQVHIVTKQGIETWPLLTKEEIAGKLIPILAGLVRA